MAQDNSSSIRQRAQLERKQNRRASYDRILIASEGTKTEPLYFEEIRRTYRLHTANVVVQPSELGTQPLQVVQYARDLFENGDRHKKIPPRAFERVFAVFDRDDHRTYHDALALAASLSGKLRNDTKQPVDFRAIASVPCFELWLLLHFEDIQQPLHRDDVLRRIKRHIQAYEKGMVDSFRLTHDKFDVAHDRARRRTTLCTAFDGAEPYTDMDLVVELLIGLGR
jgi:hypothetical protein